MAGEARGIRIPDPVEAEIEREAEIRGASFSFVAAELLREGGGMRRVTGIVFTDGPSGRRPTAAGTGLDVWEVIATRKAAGESMDALAREYDRLTEFRLRSALAYYRIYPEEVDTRLEREARWSAGTIRDQYPFLLPRR